MTHAQITGTMGAKADGSQRIFLVGNKDYTATKDWLAAQSKAPETGDYLVTDDQGSVTLQTEAQVKSGEEASAEASADTQKKTDGLNVSGTGLKPSPLPEYISKPFTVSAGKITALNGDNVVLENGASVTVPGIEKSGRITVGDYWVSHEGENAPGGFLPAADFDKMFALKE